MADIYTVRVITWPEDQEPDIETHGPFADLSEARGVARDSWTDDVHGVEVWEAEYVNGPEYPPDFMYDEIQPLETVDAP